MDLGVSENGIYPPHCQFSRVTDNQPVDLDPGVAFSQPIPAIGGGLLALSRRWWEETGGYDTKMVAWGGENIDQSLRSWLCGGRIEVADGAYVAHMWRDPKNPKTAAMAGEKWQEKWQRLKKSHGKNCWSFPSENMIMRCFLHFVSLHPIQ